MPPICACALVLYHTNNLRPKGTCAHVWRIGSQLHLCMGVCIVPLCPFGRADSQCDDHRMWACRPSTPVPLCSATQSLYGHKAHVPTCAMMTLSCICVWAYASCHSAHSAVPTRNALIIDRECAAPLRLRPCALPHEAFTATRHMCPRVAR